MPHHEQDPQQDQFHERDQVFDEDTASPLARRIAEVKKFSELADRLFVIDDVAWADAMDGDIRLLAVNAAFRRQLESIRAALLLSTEGLGHLAVGFVRASLEEVMYLGFLQTLDREPARKLFMVLGQWDSFRSLLAQRAHVGDEVMHELWFTDNHLRQAETSTAELRKQLKVLGKHYGWGGLLPNGDWVAERAGQRPLYDYLHSASSRAVHFSAGEVLRRAWGHPDGQITTNKPEFRDHLTNFALHQLVLLFFEMWSLLDDPAKAGVTLSEDVEESEVEAVVQAVASLGQVPLVHAHEWNLTPDGPLPLSDQRN